MIVYILLLLEMIIVISAFYFLYRKLSFTENTLISKLLGVETSLQPKPVKCIKQVVNEALFFNDSYKLSAKYPLAKKQDSYSKDMLLICRHSAAWSDKEETDALYRFCYLNQSCEDIAKVHQRTANAISLKLRSLFLIIDPTM